MATLSSFSTHLILSRFILSRPIHAAVVYQAKQTFLPLRTTPYFSSSRFICLTRTVTQQHSNDVALFESLETESEGETNAVSASSEVKKLGDDVGRLEYVETESEGEIDAAGASSAVTEDLKKSNLVAIKTPPPPDLSAKEKKELASYAHSLGKKLKSQQVGKSGVTDTVVIALIETLEANELLKLKIHNSCPGELEDVVERLEQTTGSVAVGKIGRTVILYRPSLAKQLKEEEKKKRAQRVYSKRQPFSQQSYQRRRAEPEPGQEPRESTRGRRGSSRF